MNLGRVPFFYQGEKGPKRNLISELLPEGFRLQ